MHCQGCPRKTESSCGSRGRLSAPVLVVGMAPGRDELVDGRPFVGSSGRLLWKAFYEAGLSPDNARVMNVINCYPALNEGKKISPEQWLACAQRFEEECAASQARIVLALGNEAMLRTTGIKGEITRWRGHIITPRECTNAVKIKGGSLLPSIPPNCEIIIPSLHPAYIIRSGLKPVPFLWADVERVERALRGDLQVVPTNDIGAWCMGARCVDLETDGIGDDANVTLIGVAGPTATGISARTWAWPPPQHVIDELKGAPLLVGHHLAFDLLHLRREGIRLNNALFDTMWAGHKVQPDLEKNLDTMSSLYLDCPRFKSIPTTNPERPRMDALYTLAMVKPQRVALQELKQLETFELEMRCLPILIDMTEAGVRVDPVERDRLASGLRMKLEEARATWDTIAPAVNAQSHVQLKKLLYDVMGLPHQYKDKKLTTEKIALVKLLKHADESGRHIIRTLIEVRESSKLLGTYFTTDRTTVHPSYFPVQKDDATYGTPTGRLSAQDPNIQNIPKQLRTMFVPHNPRNVFVVGDWSQIEAWIGGTLSGDTALLTAIAGDIHAVNAELLKCDRTRSKGFYYGTTYGAGVRKIHETMLGKGFDVEYEDIARMMKLFKSAYPQLMAWRQVLVADVKRDGYAENCFGRRRYFYDAQAAAPEIWAFHPSSNAADILWRVMPAVARLAQWAAQLPPAMFIHDEIVIESPPEKAQQVAACLKEIMECRWDLIAPGFSVPAKITMGTSWGAAA